MRVVVRRKPGVRQEVVQVFDRELCQGALQCRSFVLTQRHSEGIGRELVATTVDRKNQGQHLVDNSPEGRKEEREGNDDRN